VKRSELEHVLRAAATIAEDHEVLVIGSQAVLASFPEDELPPTATLSMEVDIAFFDDADNRKSDLVDARSVNCRHSTRRSATTPRV
jgi:hypothetical protein